MKNEIERILKIFNQSYVTGGDKKTFEFLEKDLEDDELLQLIASRLRKIEIEEEVEHTIEQHIREKQELQKEVARLRRELKMLRDDKKR